MNQQVLLGIACCAILVVFFLVRGQKNDPVSWLALVIGVVLILVICANWHAIAQWWPATAAPLPAVAPVSPAPSETANEAIVHLLNTLGDGVITVFLVLVTVLITILAFVRRNQPKRSPIHPTRQRW